MNNNAIAVLFVIVILYLANSTDVTESPSDDNNNNLVDYSDLIDAGVVFTAQNMHKLGTAITTEEVRAIRFNEEKKDLGEISLNKGTLATTPGVDYKFYFFLNTSGPSTTYYVHPQSYTAPAKESSDNLVGKGCEIGNLTYSTWTNNEMSMLSSSNAQAMSTTETKKLIIKLTALNNKCFGNPYASKDNMICFAYNSSVFSSIEASTGHYSAPNRVDEHSNSTGKAITCYRFDKIKDKETVKIPITVATGSTEPTAQHNISVFADDINIDLNAYTLDEIEGFVDEDGNVLGLDVRYLGEIFIS